MAPKPIIVESPPAGPVADQHRRVTRHWRVAALLLTVVLGVAVGVLVREVWHSDAGFLAVPGLLALAWLFVADPTRCESRDKGSPS